jgi:hypothetical protein
MRNDLTGIFMADLLAVFPFILYFARAVVAMVTIMTRATMHTWLVIARAGDVTPIS